MRRRSVKVGPQANADIRRLGDSVALFVSPINGERLVERLFDFVWRLDLASQRGTDRADIKPGLRLIPFEKVAMLAVLVDEESATVVRVFFRGQNWEKSLRKMFPR